MNARNHVVILGAKRSPASTAVLENEGTYYVIAKNWTLRFVKRILDTNAIFAKLVFFHNP